MSSTSLLASRSHEQSRTTSMRVSCVKSLDRAIFLLRESWRNGVTRQFLLITFCKEKREESARGGHYVLNPNNQKTLKGRQSACCMRDASSAHVGSSVGAGSSECTHGFNAEQSQAELSTDHIPIPLSRTFKFTLHHTNS